MTLDAARESLSRANTNIGNAHHGRANAFYDLEQARQSGDPFDLARAEAAMRDAEAECERSERDLAAAEAQILALYLEGEY
jgi:multidrug resistance efflux pump